MDPVRHVASRRRPDKTRQMDAACFHPRGALPLVPVSTPLTFLFYFYPTPNLGQKCDSTLPKKHFFFFIFFLNASSVYLDPSRHDEQVGAGEQEVMITGSRPRQAPR